MRKRIFPSLMIVLASVTIAAATFVAQRAAQRAKSSTPTATKGQAAKGRTPANRNTGAAQTPVRQPDPNRAPQPAVDDALYTSEEFFGTEAFVARPYSVAIDRVNALLSYTYALMVHDCVAALTAAGLDPDVGFLHADRPGRPGLALDLVEEFRTLVADRLVLALINRQQLGPGDFQTRDGGAVELTPGGRKALVQAYVARKREEVTHPLLDTRVRVGQLPYLQAKLLARHLRGDAEGYPPCIIR